MGPQGVKQLTQSLIVVDLKQTQVARTLVTVELSCLVLSIFFILDLQHAIAMASLFSLFLT